MDSKVLDQVQYSISWYGRCSNIGLETAINSWYFENKFKNLILSWWHPLMPQTPQISFITDQGQGVANGQRQWLITDEAWIQWQVEFNSSRYSVLNPIGHTTYITSIKCTYYKYKLIRYNIVDIITHYDMIVKNWTFSHTIFAKVSERWKGAHQITIQTVSILYDTYFHIQV